MRRQDGETRARHLVLVHRGPQSKVDTPRDLQEHIGSEHRKRAAQAGS